MTTWLTPFVRFDCANRLAGDVRIPLWLGILLFTSPISWATAAEEGRVVASGPIPEAPPPVLPVEVRKTLDGPIPAPQLLEGLTLYSIGEPTDQEQFYVELINRARANPAAEAQRLRSLTDPDIVSAYTYFRVNLDQMVADFSSLSPVPPLSIHGQLTAAARLHSADMFTNDFQDHIGSDGLSPGSRITAQGYDWSTYGENIFAYAKSVEHGHAGFEVDWGYGPDGMQSPPGHRLNLHSGGFREIGVGVVLGSNVEVGPQIVTQDLASRSGWGPFITGVVYYDLNGNGFYDLGEGLGGVEVTTAASSYYAITAGSGGYSVPVPANTTVSLTFRALGLSDYQRTVSVGTGNLKVDYAPAYAPPVISGPDVVYVGFSNALHFSPVGLADSYEWERAKRIPLTAVEGAEEGLAQVTATVSSGYAVVTSAVRASGAYSFHLAHPRPPTAQALRLNRVIWPGPNSALTFASRLGWATTDQVATAQISTNGGGHWVTVWSRAGTQDAGQGSFTNVQVPLGSWAGHSTTIRFVYDITGLSYYSQTDPDTGWHIDDITVTGSEELTELVVGEVDSALGHSIGFVPEEEGDYNLRVRARMTGRVLDWGPAFLTHAVRPLIQVQFFGVPRLSGGRVVLEFGVSGVSGSNFEVEIASRPDGPWSVDTTASVQSLVPGSRFRADVSSGNGQRAFYRIVVP